MPSNDVTQPGVVPVVGGLPGLTAAQRRILFRHTREAFQYESEFDRHGFLAPECAVIVEHGNTLLARDKVFRALLIYARHEVQDRALGCAIFPGTKTIIWHLALLQ